MLCDKRFKIQHCMQYVLWYSWNKIKNQKRAEIESRFGFLCRWYQGREKICSGKLNEKKNWEILLTHKA